MNATIQKIIDKLQKYPDATYTHADDVLTVDPLDNHGFAVTISIEANELIVSADLWHEHFEAGEEEKALNCFAFLLSDACRLKIEYKGEKPKTWTIESFENGQWVTDSTTGLFHFMFWQPKRVAYYQNKLIQLN